MSLYESLLRPLAFKMDPEKVHNLAMSMIERGLVRCERFDNPVLHQRLFDVDFPNPIGLAAGFDKNAAAIDQWQHLGFGFAEVGTITHLPQPGSPKPRLFRLPDQQAIINRMGFNNDGAVAVANRIGSRHRGIPTGINLGKSKVTELERAPEDYRESFRLLQQLGDYYVVNVSSPNTPGLRSLQDKGPLTDIVQAIKSVDADAKLFIKVAPDLEFSALDEVSEVVHSESLTGLIATNTTISREGIIGPSANEVGGLSGAPVFARSNAILRHLSQTCDRSKTLIGVGGIFTGADAYEKLKCGAHLCQIYTGWIYGGPASIPRILRELVDCLHRDGVKSLEECRPN